MLELFLAAHIDNYEREIAACQLASAAAAIAKSERLRKRLTRNEVQVRRQLARAMRVDPQR